MKFFKEYHLFITAILLIYAMLTIPVFMKYASTITAKESEILEYKAERHKWSRGALKCFKDLPKPGDMSK